MKKILLWLISILSILHFGEIYAQTWEILEDKSIKEIKQNIEKLNSDKNLISNQYTEFKYESNLATYFKSDLTRVDIGNIETLINQYNERFSELNQELIIAAKNLENTQEIRNQILQAKKDMYLEMLEYIDSNKYNQYLDYIRWDATISKKQVDIRSEIVSKEEIYEKKVTTIEKKIEQNKIEVAQRLEKVISDKIDEKISDMKNNESFNKLSIDLQVQVIEKTIEKVDSTIESLKLLDQKDININQKIDLYYILKDKLIEFRNDLLLKKEQWM